MSSVPPPPGGYPPYDPKAQWRMYRAQQKAAWKAQRMAWKAHYVGAYGPRVPSLIGPLFLIAIGVVWLLVYSGKLSGGLFWSWYAHWWPALLIAAGVALLAEWALDMRRATPVRRSAGFVWILVVLALMGLASSGWSHLAGVMGPWNWNDDNGDFWSSFGMPQHDQDQQAITESVPANAAIDIENPRGDVSVTTNSGATIEVQAHEIAYADNDSNAGKIFSAEKTSVKVSGAAVLVESGSNDHGRVNLSVTVPAGAHVTVNAGRGDITADGMGAGINVTSAHGDVRLNSITGPALVHFAKGDLTAHGVSGDVTADGSCGDVTMTDVKGGLTLTCQYFNDMHLQQVAGAIRLKTSKTDVQVAGLPGDLTLNDDALSVTEAKGNVHVVTHSRDVDLTGISGDSYVENSDGTIAISPAGPFAVEAHNSKGDVEITLPANASGTVDGRSHNGDIVTDFPLSVSGDEDKTVTGRIGAGLARIVLSAQNGDVRIKKGSMESSVTVPEANPPQSAAPPNARHLKGQAPQAVTE